MTAIKMTRLLPAEAKDNPDCFPEFLEDGKENKLVAVYIIHFEEWVNLFISEYEDGRFWTIAERDDCMGTLTECINHLLKFFR